MCLEEAGCLVWIKLQQGGKIGSRGNVMRPIKWEFFLLAGRIPLSPPADKHRARASDRWCNRRRNPSPTFRYLLRDTCSWIAF